MPRRPKDDIDRFLAYGLDLTTRTLYLGSQAYAEGGESGVDWLMADRAIKALHVLDTNEGAIHIKLNTPGGEWEQGMAICDAISECRNHVTITGYGQVCSMGAIILQAADDRRLTPNTVLMVHYGSESLDDTYWNNQARVAHSNRIVAYMEALFVERIREKHPEYGVADFRTEFRNDVWLTAEDAVRKGLADSVTMIGTHVRIR